MAARNFFELFALPSKQTIDEQDLEARQQALLKKVHPDCHVNASMSQQRLAEQYTAEINEAYRVLANPLTRAAYLLAQHGSDPFAEQASNRQMPVDFLERQMELHERFDDIADSGDKEEANRLTIELEEEIKQEMGLVGLILDGDNPSNEKIEDAVASVRKLRYLTNSRDKAVRLAKQG